MTTTSKGQLPADVQRIISRGEYGFKRSIPASDITTLAGDIKVEFDIFTNDDGDTVILEFWDGDHAGTNYLNTREMEAMKEFLE